MSPRGRALCHKAVVWIRGGPGERCARSPPGFWGAARTWPLLAELGAVGTAGALALERWAEVQVESPKRTCFVPPSLLSPHWAAFLNIPGSAVISVLTRTWLEVACHHCKCEPLCPLSVCLGEEGGHRAAGRVPDLVLSFPVRMLRRGCPQRRRTPGRKQRPLRAQASP